MNTHRALIRFHGITADNEAIALIPAWNGADVLIPVNSLPDFIKDRVLDATEDDPFRCYAKMNLIAEDESELNIHNYER